MSQFTVSRTYQQRGQLEPKTWIQEKKVHIRECSLIHNHPTTFRKRIRELNGKAVEFCSQMKAEYGSIAVIDKNQSTEDLESDPYIPTPVAKASMSQLRLQATRQWAADKSILWFNIDEPHIQLLVTQSMVRNTEWGYFAMFAKSLPTTNITGALR
ncbi:unnamed protein product, partial [Iphiclides podalirius]